jgi:TonB family protein
MKTTLAITIPLVGLLAMTPSGRPQAPQNQVVADKDMKLVDFEDLVYPALGRTAHVEGVVVVRVKLDQDGKVVDARPISGSEVLIPDCLLNARRWQFRPNAEKTAVIVYNFRLTDAVSKSGCSHFMLQAPNFATVTSCVPELK